MAKIQAQAKVSIKPYTRDAGWYRELGPSRADAPALCASIRPRADADADRVLQYLDEAPILIVTVELWDDVIAEQEERQWIGALRIHTDGEWEWRSDIAYYYRKYHVQLPDEFLWHVRYRLWTPPTPREIGLPDWCGSGVSGDGIEQWKSD